MSYFKGFSLENEDCHKQNRNPINLTALFRYDPCLCNYYSSTEATDSEVIDIPRKSKRNATLLSLDHFLKATYCNTSKLQQISPNQRENDNIERRNKTQHLADDNFTTAHHKQDAQEISTTTNTPYTM